MKRFYATFLVLLVTASVALTALISVGARMREGDGGATSIVVAAISFLAMAMGALLLVRIMLVLARRGVVDGASEEGGSR
jgi:hypothetical protein